MESQILQTIGFITILVIAGVVFGAIPYFIFSGAYKCYRCNLRIASVKSRDVTSLSTTHIAKLGRYVGQKLCSDCWKELDTDDFPTGQTWLLGATIEYLKSTPNFIALFISIGALAVAIIALLR